MAQRLDTLRISAGTMVFCVAALGIAGCASLWLEGHGKGKSPLRPPSMSGDVLVLETCVIRLAAGDESLGEGTWKEIDEQRLPAELRRRLLANGLRAGICPVAIPASIARVIGDHTNGRLGPAVLSVTPELSRPTVESWHRQVRANSPLAILESDLHDPAHLLVCSSDGGIHGRRLAQARFLLRLAATETRSGIARLEIVPVVLHGAPAPRIIARDNVLWPEHGQPEIVFDDLRITVDLSPGETLLLGGIAQKRKSVGGFLFREETDAKSFEKLLLVRLAQTQQDARFDYETWPASAVEGQSSSTTPADTVPPAL